MFISLTAYLVPTFYLSCLAQPQDLRKKYGNWAVVTGASSGIGKAITEDLAEQGVNVVMIALENDLLHESHAELQKQYGAVELRAVGVDLGHYGEGDNDYMKLIREATDDIPVSIVFNNAGYLLMGFFEKRNIDAHISNLECNSVSGVRIIHHFYSRMVTEGIKGCVVLTSSAASFLVSHAGFHFISQIKQLLVTLFGIHLTRPH